MNYSVLRKFLSTTSLIAVAAALTACSGEVDRFGSPGYSGYTSNQKDVFTNSIRSTPVQTVVNQPMPAAVPVVQQPTYPAPVYNAPVKVSAAPLVANSVQKVVRTPVQSYPMPPQVASNIQTAAPVYQPVAVYTPVQVPVAVQPVYQPVAQVPMDYTSTSSVNKSALNKPPVTISRFHSLPKSSPKRLSSQRVASVPAPAQATVPTQRVPVAMPALAQVQAPKPVEKKPLFSITRFFSLPKKAPKNKSVDYQSTASIPRNNLTPPAPVPTSSGGQKVASVAPISFQNTGSVRTSGKWTSAGGSMVTVRPGEDIQTLSRRYGVPSKAIADVNGLVDQSFVTPGQRVLIPVYQQPGSQSYAVNQQTASLNSARVAEPSVIRMPKANPLRLQSQTPYGQKIMKMQQTANADRRHMVMPGDNLHAIASRYKVSVADLAQANRMSVNSPVRMGQRLHIPQAAPANTANGIDYTSTASISHQPLGGNASSIPSTPHVFRLTRIPVSKPRQLVRQSVMSTKTSTSGAVAALPKKKVVRQRVASLEQPVGLPDKVKSDAKTVSSAVPSQSSKKVASAPTGVSNSPKFRWPVRGRIISNYGRKRDGGRNDGINLAVPSGTSVRVAESGTVIYSGSKLKGYGNLVLVQHSNGWVTAYAHNEKALVTKGQQVRRGQIIAHAGKSGDVDSPQLHFELRIKGDPVDPVPYLVST